MDYLEKIGLPYTTYRDWKNERRFPTDDMLHELAANMNVRFEWLKSGEGFRDQLDLEKFDADFEKALSPATVESIQVPLYLGKVDQAPPQYEEVDGLPGRAPGMMYPGPITATDEKRTTIPDHESRWIDPELFDMIALRLDDLGDGMSPVIPEGSIIYVDRRYEEKGGFKDGAVYAVRLEDSAVAARYVKRIDGGFLLFAENSRQCPPQVVTWTDYENEFIIGRVVAVYRNIADVVAESKME